MGIQQKYQFNGVTGLRVGRFKGGINTSFVVYCYDSVAIDTGPSNQWNWVKPFLQEENVSQVLITHYHEDHSGNAGNIQQVLNIPLFTNELTQDKISEFFRIPSLRRIVWGHATPAQASLIPDNIALPGGETLTVLKTPGHSADMTCFLLKEKGWLFAGDLYIASKVRYLHTEEDLNDVYQSLNLVLAQDIDVVFCPHRGVIEKGREALLAKRNFIESLAIESQAMKARGFSNRQIKHKLVGREDWFTLFSQFEFSKSTLIDAALKLNLDN